MKSHRILVVILTSVLVALLWQTAYNSHGSLDNLATAFRPGAGRPNSVTPRVFLASELLALVPAKEFDLAPELSDDVYFHERMTEFNYPNRVRPGAQLVLAPASEKYINEPGVLLRTDQFVIYERNRPGN